ncbi:hypothetical protein TNCV_4806361 [Trichonephila clavipes]|nr:hypothetical protein TNCV_4806361 [Trichonephila clavipes]
MGLSRDAPKDLPCKGVVKPGSPHITTSWSLETAMSHDYGVCKRPFKRLFGLGPLGKIQVLRTVSHRQSSGAFLWGGNWASKLPASIGIRLYGATLKRDTKIRGM